MNHSKGAQVSGKSDSRPTCVELFAGAGGLLLGLETAGFRTLVANEVHPHPCLTLRWNFPSVPILEGSIRDLSGKQLLTNAGVSGRDADVDLVAGGPPCQGFSTAGLKDKTDPRNTYVGDFIRIINEIRPRFFMMENVTGLVTMYRGKLFDHILDEFDSIGYKFHHSVLFAADYGVPQMRRRLVILGAREEPTPLFPLPTNHSPAQDQLSLLDRSIPTYVTCGDALGDLPLIDQGEVAHEYEVGPSTQYQALMRAGVTNLTNHEASRHRPETTHYLGLIPPGGTALDIPLEHRKAKQGIQRWPLGGIARTITTEPTDFVHPTLDRIPTIRELARIQSFPDRFRFLGQRTTGNKMRRLGYCSQSQQVGNAVPPLLAEAIGRMIASAC